MNIKGVLYYLGLFCFPISFLAFLNILYSSYFDYFLNVESYVWVLFSSFLLGFGLFFVGKKSIKKINFHEQLILIILIYLITSLFISIPYYLSGFQMTFINSLFEAFSGLTGTGFSIFKNIKYLDPTLIIWRSSSQWIGGLYFIIFLVLFFSNTQFNYKLNNLVFNSDKSLNPETNIKKISLKLFFLYSSLTVLIFFLFTFSGTRLFNGLNLSMSLISNGGFLPTNSLEDIIDTTPQKIILIFSFFLSIFNIYLFFNIFVKKQFLKKHLEDIYIFFLIIIFSLVLTIFVNQTNLLDNIINVLSSIATSGISTNNEVGNYTFYLLLLTILGGSIISNTSGIKFLRFYILLKSSFIEISKLVRPNDVVKQSILLSNNKINNENIKLSFLIFISFFISIFLLSAFLIFDNMNFETAFKLSILTLTNTSSSSLYGLDNIDYSSLLTSTKLFLIIFMIIGKIELISFFLIIKNTFFKD